MLTNTWGTPKSRWNSNSPFSLFDITQTGNWWELIDSVSGSIPQSLKRSKTSTLPHYFLLPGSRYYRWSSHICLYRRHNQNRTSQNPCWSHSPYQTILRYMRKHLNPPPRVRSLVTSCNSHTMALFGRLLGVSFPKGGFASSILSRSASESMLWCWWSYACRWMHGCLPAQQSLI